jgi:Caspase domain
MKEQGACAKLVVVDASRRNPYERRFRGFSHGLAPIAAPDNALILTSATPGKVADDGKGQHSVLVTELLTNIGARDADKPTAAEAIFNKTSIAIAKASDGEQVPSVSSSLLEDVSFAATDKAGS